MFSSIIYYLFRTIAQVYLYFTNTVTNCKTLRDCWEKNGVTYERYRIQNEGHTRFFVFVKNGNTPYYLGEDLDWHQIIQFSDSILACTFTDAVGGRQGPIEITDTIKEFSHYIYSNPFLTFNDLLTLFPIDSDGPYNVMIIFDDLSEKEFIVRGDDSLQMIFKKPKRDPLEEVPFM
jgi:hypothetical protein